MGSIVESVLQGGSLPLAFWTGLAGTALLLAIGLSRRLRAGAGRRQRRPRPAALALAPEAEQVRGLAQSAYAAQSAPAPITRSSAPPSLPITPGAAPPAVQCPAELSRRIDRLEAKVRARRAGSNG